MADTKKTATKKNTKAKAPKVVKTSSNLASIKDAIIYAHDTLFNSRALSVKDFDEVGLTGQAHTQWCAFIEELRMASNNYIDLAQDKNASPQKIQAAQGQVWSEWRRVLKQGTEGDFNANMFVRKADVVFIAGLCGTKFQKTATAKVLAHHTATDFRRNIETLIGIRMAGNAILSDADRDIIANYEAAARTIKTREDALNGYTRGKNTVEGLNDKLARQEAALAKTKATYDSVGLTAEQQADLLAPLNKTISETKANIKIAKEAIAKANKVVVKTEDSYKRLMALIRPIAGDTFGEVEAPEVDEDEFDVTDEEPQTTEVPENIEQEAEAKADAPANVDAA